MQFSISVFGVGWGIPLGFVAVIFKRFSVLAYRLYVGCCLSFVGFLLAFRLTLKFIPLNLQTSAADPALFHFLFFAICGFYLPFAITFSFISWLGSKGIHR